MIKQTVAMPYYKIVATPKMYKGIISQDGTLPPVVGLLTNELGEVEWRRNNAGLYSVSWPGIENTLNTISIQPSGLVPTTINAPVAIGQVEIDVSVYDTGAGVYNDGLMEGGLIEIIAYQIPI